MIDAKEREKLLVQIAQLEKTSVNYFDVEKEFFLIDSDNLSQVRPRLYGYSVQRSGIYEDDNLTLEAIAGLDGRGCYVYINVQDGKITVKQDLNGCWGIYLFRHGDYFALSNSFFRLLDHVKFRYPLTVNRDYCHYLMLQSYASYSYSETAVNEIQLVDRNAILHIDTANKNLQVEMIDYKEHTRSLNSAEGVAALDRWIDFWSSVIRGIAQNTKFIQTDLSGGFDTRVALVPVLHSGVDLSKIRFHSIISTLHTLKEDYEIASKIAQHYNFKLNAEFPERQSLNYSLMDNFNFDLYGNQTFSIIPKFWLTKGVDKFYSFGGTGGESIRRYFFGKPKNFIKGQIAEKTSRYSHHLSDKLSNSIETILRCGFRSIQNKYKIEDPNSENITLYLSPDAMCRHHFGKDELIHYLLGNFRISCIFDPELYSLKLSTPECSDSNLLVAMIYSRYEPDLLKFPFDSKHSIAPETIAYAKKINERFPRPVATDKANRGGTFNLQPRDAQAEKIFNSGRKNPNIPGGLPEACLKAAFDSSRTYGLFTTYFDEELYRYAAFRYDTDPFRRYRTVYSVVGVTRVLEDVEISQRNRPLYQDMKRFLESDFATIHGEANKILNRVKNYLTARVDVALLKKDGDLKILSVSDDMAIVRKPDWMKKDGIGYEIHSYAGNIEIVAKSTTNGRIRLHLLGMNIPNLKDKSKRLPYWIDYTKLTVNGKVIFDKLTPAWHDKLYSYIMDAKAEEEIKIQIEWLPHRADDVIDKVAAPISKPVVEKIATPSPKPLVVSKFDEQIVSKFRYYFTARVDIKLMTTTGDFQVISLSDEKAHVKKPAWLQKGSIGYQINSYAGKLEFIAKATADGLVVLHLRGVDVRDSNDKSKRIPYWIDYTKLTVNADVIFDKLTPAWHDKPYRYNLNMKAGEEIKVQVEWLPHEKEMLQYITKNKENTEQLRSKPTSKVDKKKTPKKAEDASKFFPYPIITL